MLTKYALITGGSGYVGSAVAKSFIANGYDVINLGRSESLLSGMKTSICNLADQKETVEAAEKILEEYGSPEVIVHMACPPTTRKSLEATTPEEVSREMAIAVGAARVLAATFLPKMKENSAFIGITTASLLKQIPENNIGAYIPAKKALQQMLRALHEQWGDRGIRVYAVAPVFLPGGLNKDLPEGVRSILSRQKDGSQSSAADVARLVLDLATTTKYKAGSSIEVPSLAVSLL